MSTQSKVMKICRITIVEAVGIGERIKKARLSLPRNGKSLDQLCDEVGISRTTWYNIEREKIKEGVSEELLRKIESAIGVEFGITFDD